jgi:RNA recognition motif-containing protein
MEIDPNITFNNALPTNQRLEPSRCVDLIVLGINYRSNEEDVRNYFQQFGELVFCEVRTPFERA